MKLSKSYLFVMLLLVILAGCVNSESADAVDQVARQFSVPRERVIKVAEELGVDPADVGTFGSYFFPYNYYEHQFELFEQEHERPPTRSEVEQIVKGYVAKCDEGSRIAYIYYSERTHPEWTNHEVAMVIRIDFQDSLPNGPEMEDLPFMYMQPINLQDESVNPPHETYWDECIREYLHEHEPPE